jgi:hypothetical protein
MPEDVNLSQASLNKLAQIIADDRNRNRDAGDAEGDAGRPPRRSDTGTRSIFEAQVVGHLKGLAELAPVKPFKAAADELDRMTDPAALDFMNELQRQFGGIAGEGGKAFQDGISLGSQYSKIYLDFNEQVHGQLESSVDGLNVSLNNLLGGTEQAFQSFMVLTEGSQSSADGLRTLQTATSDTALEMAVFGQQMKLSTQETATFVSRAIDLQGEANTSLLQEAAVMSKRVADVTGDSSKEILSIVQKLVDDTERYGNVSMAEAARIGGSLRQLGLDYSELSGMTDKFFNFETAAQSVSALTSVFGVQIDAMEAMRLANSPDRLEFLTYMRDQFINTGKSVEDMSLAEKRLIAQQTGLKSVSAVERLLDPTSDISSIEELEAATEEGMGSVSENMETLEGDIRKFGRTAEDAFNDLADATHDALIVKSQRALLTYTSQVQETFTGVEKTMQNQVPQIRETLGIAGITEDLEAALKNYGVVLDEVLAGFQGALDQIVPALAESLRLALEEIRTNSATKKESPSLMGLAITDGITAAFDALPDDVGTVLSTLKDMSGDIWDSMDEDGRKAVEDFSKHVGKLGIEYTDLTDREREDAAAQLGITQDVLQQSMKASLENKKERDKAQEVGNMFDALLASSLEGNEDDESVMAALDAISENNEMSRELTYEAFERSQSGSDYLFEQLVEAGEEEPTTVAEAQAPAATGEARETAASVQEDSVQNTAVQQLVDAAERMSDLAEAESTIEITLEGNVNVMLPSNQIIAVAALDGMVADATSSGGKAMKAVLSAAG